MSSYASVDFSDFRRFFEQMDRAARGGLRHELEVFLEGLAYEFLDMVQDEFTNRNKNTGYGQLVNSFTKDDTNNIWRYGDGRLTIEIGSSLEYAGYVNDGHRTLDPAQEKYFVLSTGEKARFVPGYWQGERFIYDPAAENGMLLKYHWVEGLHFWEAAMHTMEENCPEFLNAKMEQWLDEYFNF